MSEEIFRIVVATGVVLASIGFLVQAGVIFALYRVIRGMESKSKTFIAKVEPMLMKVGPTLDKAGPIIDEIGPIIARARPVVEKFGPLIERLHPVIEKTAFALDRVPPVIEDVHEVVEKAGALAQRLNELTASANQVILTANAIMIDARPQLREISSEAAGIVRSGREQVERVGEILHDAGDVARTRIHQIDQAVGATVGQVEQVGDSVKSAVMRPVREVNGLAAGISAAVSMLVRGQRKSSVDAATQDEEMFI